MNTGNFKHYCVFTQSPEAGHDGPPAIKALGNKASVILTATLPSHNLCLAQTRGFEQTTCVFIAPNKKNQEHCQSFDIAWYHSGHRIQRCGHGTLAAAYYLHNTIKFSHHWIFNSDKESLIVTHQQGQYALQFKPMDLIADETTVVTDAQRVAKTQADNGYYLIGLNSETAVKDFALTDDIIAFIKQRALIITSLANHPQYDIVFRYFAPQYGNFEDQATGSAGPCLWAFWQQHHSNKTLNCYQASARGGVFTLTKPADHIVVGGYVTEK